MPSLRVLKCPRCGSLFTKDRHPICPACWRAEQTNLDRVRRHLDENPGSTAAMVAAETGVPEEDVVRFIREGHLIIAPGHGIQYPCDACGKPIAVGRFCPECSGKLTKGLEDATDALRRGKRKDHGWKKDTIHKVKEDPEK